MDLEMIWKSWCQGSELLIKFQLNGENAESNTANFFKDISTLFPYFCQTKNSAAIFKIPKSKTTWSTLTSTASQESFLKVGDVCY